MSLLVCLLALRKASYRRLVAILSLPIQTVAFPLLRMEFPSPGVLHLLVGITVHPKVQLPSVSLAVQVNRATLAFPQESLVVLQVDFYLRQARDYPAASHPSSKPKKPSFPLAKGGSIPAPVARQEWQV